MKMIRNKKMFQKIMIILVFLILCNFVFPMYSRAFGGGKLLNPIKDLVLGIGDAVINLTQSLMLPKSPTAVDKSSLISLEYRFYYGEDHPLTGTADALTWFTNNTWFIGDGILELSDLMGTLFGFERGEVKEQYKERVMSMIVYSPATIFSNLIPALDVNFINPKVWYRGGEGSWIPFVDANTKRVDVAYKYTANNMPANDDEKYADNTAYQLRDTIATWYKALRNVAIVGLLSVLVYIAIRIIMSSTAGETAKYKTMLYDWLIAMCILFFMHYMMAFLLKINEMVIDVFTTNVVLKNLNGDTADAQELGDKFMNETREKAEELKTNDKDDLKDLKKFGYAVIYIVLIFYTLMFTWRYLKRFVYLAFLTMISPLVALTYPLDKIKDGSAQAFNTWFREYVFNVLVQPMHLIIYTILITSAESFADSNLIYTIAAIGFLLEAENIIKMMFGFNKAQGGISSAGAAITGGAMFGAASNLLRQGANRLHGGSGDSSDGSLNSADKNKVHFNDRLADGSASKDLSSFRLGSGSGGSGSKTKATGTGKKKYNTKAFNKASNAFRKVSAPARAARRGLSSARRRVGSSRPITGIKKLGSDISRSPIGKVGSGIGSVGKRFVNKNSLKKAGRLVATGIGAATLGTIGLAAGIASDNDKDILAYTGLGVGTGALAGGKLYDAGGSLASGASSVKDDFQKGYYGEDYEEKVLNPKLDKAWAKDEDVIRHFKTRYKDEYKDRMQDALELRKAGITDQDDIDTAIDLMSNNSGLRVEEAADIMQFTTGSNGVTRSEVLKDRDKIREIAKRMVGGNDAAADRIMDLVEQRFKL